MSSRASDASDLSELGGAWLNLPLLLLSGTTDPEPAQTPRRRSAYGLPLFLRHQDAVDEESGPKRAGSLRLTPRSSVRRGSSRPRTPTSPTAGSTEVSILVTEASPDGGAPVQSEATVVRVLVHRESDEQQDTPS